MTGRPFALLILIALSFPSLSLAASPIRFSTRDHVSIVGTLYPHQSTSQATRTLIVVAPGFAATKDTAAFAQMCPRLAVQSDVLCFDFRGTGDSSGIYNFGADEYLDFEPILMWARKNYSSINLMGFSMGAYSSVRAATLWPTQINHLLLVSCPTSILDVITSGGVTDTIGRIVFGANSYSLNSGSNLAFHWGNPFSDEPNLASVASSVRMSASFLVGGQDVLVKESLSREVYNSVPVMKTWNEMPDGEHAEAMFAKHPDQFLNWAFTHQ